MHRPASAAIRRRLTPTRPSAGRSSVPSHALIAARPLPQLDNSVFLGDAVPPSMQFLGSLTDGCSWATVSRHHPSSPPSPSAPPLPHRLPALLPRHEPTLVPAPVRRGPSRMRDLRQVARMYAILQLRLPRFHIDTLLRRPDQDTPPMRTYRAGAANSL